MTRQRGRGLPSPAAVPLPGYGKGVCGFAAYEGVLKPKKAPKGGRDVYVEPPPPRGIYKSTDTTPAFHNVVIVL